MVQWPGDIYDGQRTTYGLSPGGTVRGKAPGVQSVERQTVGDGQHLPMNWLRCGLGRAQTVGNVRWPKLSRALRQTTFKRPSAPMKASWFLVILLLVFVALFSVQNAEPISVRFLAWEYSVSAALVIQLAALLGGLVGLVVGTVSGRVARRRRDEAASDRERRAREESAPDSEPADSRPITASTVGVVPSDPPRI